MRHHLDIASLVMGLAFAAVAIAGLNGWLVDVLTSPDLWEPEVLVAGGLVAVGLGLGLFIATMLGRRRRRERDRDGAGEPPSPRSVDA